MYWYGLEFVRIRSQSKVDYGPQGVRPCGSLSAISGWRLNPCAEQKGFFTTIKNRLAILPIINAYRS